MSGRVALNVFWLALGLGLAGFNAWAAWVALWWPLKVVFALSAMLCVAAALALWQVRKHRDLET